MPKSEMRFFRQEDRPRFRRLLVFCVLHQPGNYSFALVRYHTTDQLNHQQVYSRTNKKQDTHTINLIGPPVIRKKIRRKIRFIS